MKFILSILALVCMALTLNAQVIVELPAKFFTALHKQEASGILKPKDGDGGKAIGPLQIHWAYWKDAKDFAKLPGTYQDCRDLEYAKRVVTAYMNRHAKQAVRDRDFSFMARLHNEGPSRHNSPKAWRYWEQFKRHLT